LARRYIPHPLSQDQESRAISRAGRRPIVRKAKWLAGLALLLGLAVVPAWAQKSSLFQGSFSNVNIQNKPIDTTKNLSAPLPPQSQPQQSPNFFSKVTSLFSKNSQPTGKNGLPYSAGPTQDMFQPPLPLKSAPGAKRGS
jgi:hypothetical protein